MNYYEPNSRLFKKADNSKLKSHVEVYLPANQSLKESNFEETANPPLTIIEYTVVIDPNENTPRTVEMIKEFRWNGIARNVSTEVLDLQGNSGGKKVIHSNTAQVYS